LDSDGLGRIRDFGCGFGIRNYTNNNSNNSNSIENSNTLIK